MYLLFKHSVGPVGCVGSVECVVSVWCVVCVGSVG